MPVSNLLHAASVLLIVVGCFLFWYLSLIFAFSF